MFSYLLNAMADSYKIRTPDKNDEGYGLNNHYVCIIELELTFMKDLHSFLTVLGGAIFPLFLFS